MSVFLQVSDDDKIYSGVNFFLIKDRFPVSPGHILIISKELKKDFFELNDEERNELPLMIEVAKNFHFQT
jgi:diadenosine tetraphosphate (Ap4A) HIT family hydrolase